MSITNGAIKDMGLKSPSENTHTLHIPPQGFSQGKKNGLERLMGHSQEGGGLLCARSPSPNLHLTVLSQRVLEIPGTGKEAAELGFLTCPTAHGDREHPRALHPMRVGHETHVGIPVVPRQGRGVEWAIQWENVVKMKSSLHSKREPRALWAWVPGSHPMQMCGIGFGRKEQ